MSLSKHIKEHLTLGYQAIPAKIINVLSFGADPTHVTDSRAAFIAAKAAWDALGAYQQNYVFIPAGHYINSATVDWDACPVIGEGVDVTFIDPTITDGTFCFTHNANLFRAEGYHIQTGLGQAAMSGIVATNDGYCGGVQAGVFDGGDVTVTFTASTDIVNATAHPFSNSDPVQFETAAAGSSLPTGVTAGVVYYVINDTANTFQFSLVKNGAAVDFTTSGSGTLRAFSSARRGRMDVKVTGCWKSVEADGWQNYIRVWAANCGYGPRVSQQNGSVLDLTADGCLIYGAIKDCKGSHFVRLTGQCDPNGLVTATTTLEKNHGTVVNGFYIEGSVDDLRSYPHFETGTNSVTYGMQIDGFNGQADTTISGVPPVKFDKMSGGGVNGFVKVTAGEPKMLQMGANNCCFDVSKLVPYSDESSPFGFQSPFEVLQGATSCAFNPIALNPLPYFEHKGGHVYRPSDTRAATSWVASTRIPGTNVLRVTNAGSTTATSYVQHSINSNSFQNLNGKYVLAVAILNIPEHDAYGNAGKTDNLNNSTYKPGFEVILQDSSGANLATGTDLGATSQQKHRRGTIQAYASFINASALTTIQRAVFNFFCVRGAADLNTYPTVYVDVEAVFLFEVPNLATAAAVISHCFRTDLRTLNRDSVIEGGRLVTNNQPNPITASAITYSVGDLIRLTPAALAPDHKVCVTAGNYSTAVFKNAAVLSA